MPRTLNRILLAGGIALATWGLTRTVPALLGAEPGYFGRPLYLVTVWTFIWVVCLVALVRSFRR